MELVAEWWRWLMLFVIDAFVTRPRDMLGGGLSIGTAPKYAHDHLCHFAIQCQF